MLNFFKIVSMEELVNMENATNLDLSLTERNLKSKKQDVLQIMKSDSVCNANFAPPFRM